MQTRSYDLRLKADAGALLSALAALRSELQGDLSGVDVPGELRQLALDLLDFPIELAHIQTDISAAAAGDVIVHFQSSDRLADLLAALRARDGDRLIVE
jgi:hypothetical protein